MYQKRVAAFLNRFAGFRVVNSGLGRTGHIGTWGKGLECRHSIVVHVIHFSSGAILWVAPFLPTNAMQLPNYLKPHEKNLGQRRVVPLPVTMVNQYECTSPPRTIHLPVIIFPFDHRFLNASDDVIGW